MKALITGASKGLGIAIAQELLSQKYDIVIVSRNETHLKEAVKSLDNPNNQSIQYLALDLSLAEERKKLQNHPDVFADLNVLVNNLGMYYENSDASNLEKMLETNLLAAIDLTKYAEKELIKQTGNIVNIGSVMSIQAQAFAIDYSISKHALKAWNDAIREKLRPQNVSVTGIYPGAINTSSWDGQEVNREDMIQTEDIAALVGQLLKLNKSSLVEEIRLSPLQF